MLIYAPSESCWFYPRADEEMRWGARGRWVEAGEEGLVRWGRWSGCGWGVVGWYVNMRSRDGARA